MITIVSLGASAALGLGALFVAKAVLPNAAAAKTSAAAAANAGVPIVIAAKEIKFGDKLDATMLTIAHVPADVAPQGAFQTPAQVLMQDHGGAPVALTPIAVHEALLPTKLSGPGARPSVAAEIKEGMRAYTVRVNDVGGVGGHALPGDRVDVVLMRDTTPSGPTRTYVSDVVLQNVRVLGVDLNADLSANKPAEPKNATLEVSVQDAQKLSIAATLGTLSLALRRTGEADTAESIHTMATRDFVAGGAAAPPAQVRAVIRRPRVGGGGEGSLVISVVEYTGGGRRPLPAVTDAPAQPAPAASNKPAA
jgi:pilus assembly protein CpaB